MLQNKYTFTQSSAELVITGLPDFSKDDKKNKISIISNWKLSILNHPEIEGGIDHLKIIIRVFRSYASYILSDKLDSIESELIDIFTDNDGIHIISLKSTKPDIEPLKIKLGNAEFADIINCFDQLIISQNVCIDNSDIEKQFQVKKYYLNDKNQIINMFLSPLVALLSISLISIISLNYYEMIENPDKKISIENKKSTSK